MIEAIHSRMKRVTVIEATTPDQIEAFRGLCVEYAASLPFSLCFQGFDREMESLPGAYAAPAGVILLALDGAAPIGGVALRRIESLPGDPDPVSEMKRMYVRPSARGLGAGRALGERLISAARARGYRMMKLDSEPDFHAAMGLYRSLGFVDIPRYNDDPHPQTVYLGLVLGK